jgi:phosphoglycerate kinase
MAKKLITDVELNNKKVIIRVDFNVPFDKKTGAISDDNRIVAALPTIKYALEKNARVILLSHLGRVESVEDKPKATLKPVVARLSELLGKEVLFVPYTRGPEVELAIANLQPGNAIMLENTRYEDVDPKGKLESKNSPELGAYWASLGDVFINDAFATAHRKAASNAGISASIPVSAAGFLLEKEIKFLKNAIDTPRRPFVAILGGAKVSDKIKVIKNLLNVADSILIGGGMVFTFLKAQGLNIGKSLCEEDYVEFARDLLREGGSKIKLGSDCVTGKEFSNETQVNVRNFDEIPSDEMGLDIGPKTIEQFVKVIKNAKTVLWNGPLGVFEFVNYSKGTREIAEAMANLGDQATTIIGGGDSGAAVEKFGLASKITHVSTGGGASLEYLEGVELPGIACLQDK